MELLTILHFLFPIALWIINNYTLQKLFFQKMDMRILVLEDKIKSFDEIHKSFKEINDRLISMETYMKLILDDKIKKGN